MENIVTIRCGDYAAQINLSRGANCISFRNTKYHAIILREPDYTKELDNPYLYGMPILYPVNRISGGVFEFENRSYRFSINEPATNCHLHGFVHQKEFRVLEKDSSYISCVYHSEATEDFPHAYEMIINYSLSEKGLLQETIIKNLSDKNMPNFLGFHTTFQIPFIEDSVPEQVCVFTQIGEEIERDMRVYLPTGRILAEDEISEKLKSGTFMPWEKVISRHYKVDKKGLIELRDWNKNIKLVYENDEKYTWRLFYNGNADAYICLEPMTCMANCQNAPFDRNDAGFDYIEPNSEKKYVSKIYLEEM